MFEDFHNRILKRRWEKYQRNSNPLLKCMVKKKSFVKQKKKVLHPMFEAVSKDSNFQLSIVKTENKTIH